MTTNISTAGTKWNFRKYTGSDINGVEWISFNSSLIAGETFAYSAYMYSSVIGRNGPVIYSVSDDTVADIDENTGFLTTNKPGVINVRIYYPGAPWVWSRTVTVGNISVIECYNKNGYLAVPDSPYSGTYCECDEKDQYIRHIWKLEWLGSYYAIKNLSTGYYLTESDGYVKQNSTYGLFTDNQLWKVIKQSDGTYKIESKAKPGYYITEENVSHSSEDPDILVSNSSVSNRNKWHFKLVDKKVVTFLGVEVEGFIFEFDPTAMFQLSANSFLEMNNDNFSMGNIITNAIDKNKAKDLLSASSVFMSSTHGNFDLSWSSEIVTP